MVDKWQDYANPQKVGWDMWVRRVIQIVAGLVFFGLIIGDSLGYLVKSPPIAVYFMLVGVMAALEDLKDWLPKIGGR